MKISAAFFQAAYDAEKRCLGLPLKPFSLGHQILLRATGNAYGSKLNPEWGDILLGVFICCQSWEDFSIALNSRWLSLSMRLWGFRATRAVKRDKLNLAREMLFFEEYVKDGSEEPEQMIQRNAGGRSLASPWELRLKLLAMEKFPQMTESQILNRPLRLLYAELVGKMEMEGSAEPLGEQHEALFAAAEEMAQNN